MDLESSTSTKFRLMWESFLEGTSKEKVLCLLMVRLHIKENGRWICQMAKVPIFCLMGRLIRDNLLMGIERVMECISSVRKGFCMKENFNKTNFMVMGKLQQKISLIMEIGSMERNMGKVSIDFPRELFTRVNIRET